MSDLFCICCSSFFYFTLTYCVFFFFVVFYVNIVWVAPKNRIQLKRLSLLPNGCDWRHFALIISFSLLCLILHAMDQQLKRQRSAYYFLLHLLNDNHNQSRHWDFCKANHSHSHSQLTGFPLIWPDSRSLSLSLSPLSLNWPAKSVTLTKIWFSLWLSCSHKAKTAANPRSLQISFINNS